MLDDLAGRGEALLALVALLTGLGLLARKAWGGVRNMARFINETMPRIHRALDDVIGDDDRPGLVDRLGVLEDNQTTIKRELFPNGGGSLRDAVTRTGEAVARLEVEVEAAKERAAEAVDETAQLNAVLGRMHAKGQADLAQAQGSLDAVLDAFMQDRREQYRTKTAYVEALQDLGLDLTHVTRELEADPWDGIDRRA